MPTVLPRDTCGDPYPGDSHCTTRCEREPGHPGTLHASGELGWDRGEPAPGQRNNVGPVLAQCARVHDALVDAYVQANIRLAQEFAQAIAQTAARNQR